MDSINFISDDKYLLKIRQQEKHEDYWTVINKNGQIQPIPYHCESVLKWSTFSAGISRQLESGYLVMLRGGEK